MKKVLSILVILCLFATAFCGCGGKDKDKNSEVSGAASQLVSEAPATPEPVKSAKAVSINADGGLNIRSSPSTDGDIVGIADDGSKLPLLIEKPNDGWYEVVYDGSSAYVSAEFATVIEITLEEYNKLKDGESVAEESTPESKSEVNDDPEAAKSTPAASLVPTPAPTSSAPTAVGNEDGE